MFITLLSCTTIACVNNDVHIDIFEAGMMHSCEVCQEKILVTYHIGRLIICFQSSTGSPGFTQSLCSCIMNNYKKKIYKWSNILTLGQFAIQMFSFSYKFLKSIIIIWGIRWSCHYWRESGGDDAFGGVATTVKFRSSKIIFEGIFTRPYNFSWFLFDCINFQQVV